MNLNGRTPREATSCGSKDLGAQPHNKKDPAAAGSFEYLKELFFSFNHLFLHEIVDTFDCPQSLNRNHPHDCVRLIGRKIVNGLERAEMQRARGFGKHFCSLAHVFRRGKFTGSLNDDGPFFTLGFGLLGDRTFEVVRKNDVLEFNACHINAPWSGCRINMVFNTFGNILAVLQKLVQGHLTDHVTHGYLRKLGHGVVEVFHCQHGFCCVGNLVVNHRVHADGDIVLGNGFLFRNIHGLGADIHLCHRLNNREHKPPARIFDHFILTELKENPSFIFVHLADADKDDDQHDDENRGSQECEKQFHREIISE